ncbi:serine/threonine-protein kinase [Streptomyces virginiae]|uniref:serine/threonine-protein kinase n=1 Tax=Streptomyces virginiae TaxID=1961 RepID=UPI00224CF1DD|nr:serine/threonine-protein kinase [Streptomyces virginiae]MCX5174409.1 serine/threonine protein kinase [Streptomyces virginiae]
MDLSDGTVIAGRYRLAERLGGGGMGEVWRARDQRLLVDVAAKRLVLDPYATPEERRAALAYAVKESRHAAALRTHPNVVAVHDVVEDDDGIPWTVMDLVAGRSLAQALAAGDHFGPDQAARIGQQVAEALDAAHAQGITHRDVKPGNIMLGDDGRILLVDFGIARHHADTKITQTGMAVGTVEYMAPERFDGTDGPPGDLWALGVTLYETVEGISPFRRNTMMATLRAIAMDAPAPTAQAGWLAEPIRQLLDKAPGARPTAGHARSLLRGGPASVGVTSAGSETHPPTQLAIAGTLSAEEEELFDRAFRIADSIEDPKGRSGALTMVGAAAPWLSERIIPRVPADDRPFTLLTLAASTDDVDLARHLIDQAEPLIPLVSVPDEEQGDTSEQHILALSRLAGLLIHSDPDGAWQLIGRVESGAWELAYHPDDAFLLPAALARIANSVRDADPYCSRRLIDLAEQNALGLPPVDDDGSPCRDHALEYLAQAVAPVDVERAERIIGMISKGYVQVSAWEISIQELISANSGDVPHLIDAAELALAGPVRAESQTPLPVPVQERAPAMPAQAEVGATSKWWRSRKSRRQDAADLADEAVEEAVAQDCGTRDLVRIAIVVAAADTPRAERLASRITSPVFRAQALAGMAGQVAASDLGQARRWLDDAYQSALSAARTDQLDLLEVISSTAASVYPTLADQVAQRLVSDLVENESPWTLVSAAEHIAAVDPTQAVRLVDLAESRRTEPSDDMERLSMAGALATAAVALAGTDLREAKGLIRRAWRTVRRPPEVKEYVEQVWWPLEALAGEDMDAAGQLLDQLPGPDRDPVLAAAVTALAPKEPLRAEQAAQRITDDTLRKRALTEVALSIATQARRPSSA